MTRFARAKGSKASNERLPNDATPWHVMKQQLVESLAKKREPEQAKSAKELLADAEKKDDLRNTSWAEFPNDSESNSKKKKKKGKNMQGGEEKSLGESEGSVRFKKNVMNGTEEFTSGKKQKDKNKKQHDEGTGMEENMKSKKRSTNETEDFTLGKKQKTDKSKKHDANENEVQLIGSEGDVDGFKTRNINGTEDFVSGKKQKADKSKKQRSESTVNEVQCAGTEENMKSKKRSINETEDFVPGKKQKLDKKDNEITENQRNGWRGGDDKFNKRENRWQAKGEDRTSTGNDDNFRRRFNKDFTNGFQNNGRRKFDAQRKNGKPAKIRDDKVHKRRKPDLGSSKIMINGMEVEIVKFDGFPVKKEDAERLRELKQKMVMKGIPQKEINAAIKLERRKAEKALARIKKCVCFHCRKAGHNLSDCPELGSEQAGTGICFKCGSTEHTHFECKVSKPSEFRYATCFICREQGHIAKQCPDNPRGVYPQGGACKICGDVTHLKKDCPDLIKEKEEAAVTVDTIANRNLECLEENQEGVRREDKKPKKVVKF